MILNFFKDFLKPKNTLSTTHLHNYPTKLNIGCGYDKRSEYLNVDIDSKCSPDLLLDADGNLDVLPRSYFSEILASDVLEHVPRSESLRNLLTWNELLMKGGCLNIKTTDIISLASRMVSDMTYAAHHGWTICLFGNQAQPGDFHLTGFSDITLEVLLSAAGFEVITKGHIDEWMFDWTAKKIDSWTEFVEEQKQLSDFEFLCNTYRRVFLRDLDEQGNMHYSKRLRIGQTRSEVYLDIASSPEALFVKARTLNK